VRAGGRWKSNHDKNLLRLHSFVFLYLLTHFLYFPLPPLSAIALTPTSLLLVFNPILMEVTCRHTVCTHTNTTGERHHYHSYTGRTDHEREEQPTYYHPCPIGECIICEKREGKQRQPKRKKERDYTMSVGMGDAINSSPL